VALFVSVSRAGFDVPAVVRAKVFDGLSGL
jgi:hypothetical protein